MPWHEEIPSRRAAASTSRARNPLPPAMAASNPAAIGSAAPPPRRAHSDKEKAVPSALSWQTHPRDTCAWCREVADTPGRQRSETPPAPDHEQLPDLFLGRKLP